MLALQLVEGRPELLVEGDGGPLKLHINTTLHDGLWHTLHLILDAEGVVLVADLCGRGWEDGTRDDTHCLARGQWYGSVGGEVWPGSGPLQVGGVAHSPLQAKDHGWQEVPTTHHLHGCISRLTINTQVVDLGQPPYSHGSSSRCHLQEEACQEHIGVCGVRGRCAGGLKTPRCKCDPGWTGPRCATATVPVRLGVSSYMKLALSFTPAPRVLRVEVRVRTRGRRNGLLLHLAAHHRAAAFSLHLHAGVACASVSGAGWVAHTACVEGLPLGDGAWHTVRAERHGHNLVVGVDDGDGWRRNESLAWASSPPPPLHLDKHDGVTVGGLPEFVGVSLVTVHNDLQETCLDDLRVSGHTLPLSPAVNGTSWGQVTTLERLEPGCPPPAPDPCINTTCSPPLSCHLDWDQAACRCGPGRQLVGRRCEDVDECVWSPCLHGGTCHDQRPGYLCVCGPDHLGDNCQWNKLSPETHPLAAPAAIAVLTVSVLVLVVLGVVLSLRLHRLRVTRAGLQQTESGEKGSIESLKGAGGDSIGGGGGGERKDSPDDPTQDTLLQLLKLKLTGDRPATRTKKGSASDDRGNSGGGGNNGGGGGGGGGGGNGGVGGVSAVVVEVLPPPLDPVLDPTVLLPGEDLRAYAYEGDGSSSGSLTSTISGLRAELEKEEGIRPLVPGFLEAIDLLKNLPEAPRSSFRSPAVSTTPTTTIPPTKDHYHHHTTTIPTTKDHHHTTTATRHPATITTTTAITTPKLQPHTTTTTPTKLHRTTTPTTKPKHHKTDITTTTTTPATTPKLHRITTPTTTLDRTTTVSRNQRGSGGEDEKMVTSC